MIQLRAFSFSKSSSNDGQRDGGNARDRKLGGLVRRCHFKKGL